MTTLTYYVCYFTWKVYTTPPFRTRNFSSFFLIQYLLPVCFNLFWAQSITFLVEEASKLSDVKRHEKMINDLTQRWASKGNRNYWREVLLDKLKKCSLIFCGHLLSSLLLKFQCDNKINYYGHIIFSPYIWCARVLMECFIVYTLWGVPSSLEIYIFISPLRIINLIELENHNMSGIYIFTLTCIAKCKTKQLALFWNRNYYVDYWLTVPL